MYVHLISLSKIDGLKDIQKFIDKDTKTQHNFNDIVFCLLSLLKNTAV